jgi:hypothetical protein
LQFQEFENLIVRSTAYVQAPLVLNGLSQAELDTAESSAVKPPVGTLVYNSTSGTLASFDGNSFDSAAGPDLDSIAPMVLPRWTIKPSRQHPN